MLVFDEAGLGTAEQRIPWGEVCSVGIRTTADGPFAEDVFWLFVLDHGALELPGQLVQGDQLGVLQNRLSGLDNEKVVRAMGSTDERMFHVWGRDAEESRWNDARHRERFRRLVRRLGGDGEATEPVFEALRAAWGAPGRVAHTLAHLADCLHQLDVARAGAVGSDPAELALWFHDAVYVAGAQDNEKRSAQLLAAHARRLGLSRETAEEVAAMVRATALGAGAKAPDPETALVLDVDLSILGADPVRFMDFEYSVEEEFAKVPRLRFRVGRGRFLAGLLARETIFHTPFFRQRDEATARANVSALLQSPRYRAWRWTRWL